MEAYWQYHDIFVHVFMMKWNGHVTHRENSLKPMLKSLQWIQKETGSFHGRNHK
jgi:hypothetical protein